TAYTIGNEAATAPAGIRGRGARPLPRPLLTARGRPPRREGGPAEAPLRGGSVALADLEVVVLSEVGVGAAPRDADDVLVGLVARRAVHDGDLLAVAATAGAPALEGRGRRGRRLDAAVVTAAAVVVTGRVVVAGRVVVGQVVVAAAGGRVVAGDAVHAALAAGDGGVHRLQGHLDHLVAEVELAVTEAAVVGGAGPGPAVAAPVVVEVVAVELEGLEAVPGVRPLGAVPARVVDVLPADAPALVVDRVLLDEGPDGLLQIGRAHV